MTQVSITVHQVYQSITSKNSSMLLVLLFSISLLNSVDLILISNVFFISYVFLTSLSRSRIEFSKFSKDFFPVFKKTHFFSQLFHYPICIYDNKFSKKIRLRLFSTQTLFLPESLSCKTHILL